MTVASRATTGLVWLQTGLSTVYRDAAIQQVRSYRYVRGWAGVVPDTLLALARGACRLWSEPHVGDSRLGSALIRRAASVSELPDRLSVCGAVPGSGSGGGVPLRTVNPQVARPQATTCEMLGIPISTDNAQQIRMDLLPLSSSRSPDTRHVLPAGGSALLVINRNHDEQCQ